MRMRGSAPSGFATSARRESAFAVSSAHLRSKNNWPQAKKPEGETERERGRNGERKCIWPQAKQVQARVIVLCS
jgi:hypothetical protein